MEPNHQELLSFYRFALSLLFLTIFLVLEMLIPSASKLYPKRLRWKTNLGLIFVSSFITRLLPVLLPLNVAAMAKEYKIGIFHFFQMDYWIQFIVCLLILDITIYFQHRFFHQNRFFFNFHKIHHEDLELDATSALRFHPVEILFSILLKSFIILALGADLFCVFYFEVMLNGLSIFTHSNIKIPSRLSSFLEILIMTPRIHLRHHSDEISDSNSNFGFSISIWDRIFATYKGVKENEKFRLGIKPSSPKGNIYSLHKVLIHPFKSVFSKAN